MRNSITGKTEAQTLLKAIDTFLMQLQLPKNEPALDIPHQKVALSDYELARRGQAVIARYLADTQK